MEIKFSQEEEMIRKLASSFAEKELEPIAEELDKTGEYPNELFQKMVKAGFTSIGVPREYGGNGGDEVTKVIVVEELAKKCATSAGIVSINGILAQALLMYGTEEQKEEILPKITKGGMRTAFALTEPNAGSDAAAAKTRADSDGDNYIINGTKNFITGGSKAEYILVIALTDITKGVRGMSAIIVPKNTKGFSVGNIEDKMGLKASDTAELIFEDCVVPKKYLLGREGQGFKIAMTLLDGARIGVAAQALGIAEGAIDLARDYMKERVQFGKPIAAFQGLQWYMAEMATKTESAKWLTYRAAALKSQGEKHTLEAAMAKLHASENARFVTNLAQQIHGGYGYMKDYPLERMVRDAKITEIYEGTSEIHKVVIAREVIG